MEISSNGSSLSLLGTWVVLIITLLYLVNDKYRLIYHGRLWWEYFTTTVPTLHIDMTHAESMDEGVQGDPVPQMILVDENKDPTLLHCFDPSTRQHLGTCLNMTSPDQVHEILVQAKEAQESWKHTTFAQRRLVLRTIQKYICQHVEDICRVSSRESGKPKVDAVVGEIITTCEKIRTILEWGEAWLQPSYRPTGPMMMHKTAWVEYVPLGVIATIAPWNYPFHNMLNHIISGIMAGNAVVGKVSEHAAWSARYYGSIVRTALEIHGHNPNLVATITGLAPAGQALVQDPLVDKIIFTGSTPIGRKVMQGAVNHLTPVILELGGKDVMVIRHDMIQNLSQVIPWIMRGCYQNAGQNCIGVERVLVYESIHDELIRQIVPKVQAIRQGIPLKVCGSDGKVDCGSIIMPSQMEIIQSLVDDAVAKGATLHCGGKQNPNLEGQFFEPTVLSGVTPDMDIFHKEVFGPVMTIVKVPKDSDEACIELVNNSDFGLGASIFSKDAAQALAMGRQFWTGMVTVNDYATNYLIQALPFGGVKESGFGRFGGIEGLRALCLERSIVVDSFPGIIQTSIPRPLDYPIDQEKAFPFTDSLIQLFYNDSILAKLKGIVGLIKNS